jgi:hypothetical protein
VSAEHNEFGQVPPRILQRTEGEEDAEEKCKGTRKQLCEQKTACACDHLSTATNIVISTINCVSVLLLCLLSWLAGLEVLHHSIT